MKVLRPLALLAALSFVGLTTIPRAALASRGNDQGGNSQGDNSQAEAPELDPSLVIGGLGVAGGLVALMLTHRHAK